MQNTNEIRDRLMQTFSGNYMEKLFYFCLKKTGQITEAEDLAQDIALHILVALHKGTVPMNFPAWVWQIARNRYSVWAEGKRRRNESVTGSDIGDCEIPDENGDVLEDMIRREQLALLRRELAFVKSDYRNIIVAYYIENKSVREIASSLSLLETTVKQRLRRARIILKEGMDMAREFGKRSYNPEDIRCSTNCRKPGDKNQPYSIMEHKLYTNILLEVYDNPSTAEELSIELGLALPYMEEELEFLTRETLLIRNEKKYQTAFPIISAAVQEQAHFAWLASAPAITDTLVSFVNRLKDAYAVQGKVFWGNYQDFESAKWTLLLLALDYFMYGEPSPRETTIRPDNGQWDIIGYQESGVTELHFVGNHTSGNGFEQFKYEFDGIADRTPNWITAEESKLLKELVTGGTVENRDIAEKLAGYGYLLRTGKSYEPAVVVVEWEKIRETVAAMEDNVTAELAVLAEKARTLLKELYNEIRNAVCADLPAIFAEDAFYTLIAVESCYFTRSYVIADALKRGYLLPADKVSPMIGAHINTY